MGEQANVQESTGKSDEIEENAKQKLIKNNLKFEILKIGEKSSWTNKAKKDVKMIRHRKTKRERQGQLGMHTAAEEVMKGYLSGASLVCYLKRKAATCRALIISHLCDMRARVNRW